MSYSHVYLSRRDQGDNELRNTITALVAILLHALLASPSEARTMTLASTTSTEQSGLFKHVLPIFRQTSGIEVKVVAVGTGQALVIAQRGDADALLVHDREGEDKFVASGHGLDRRDVMFNDFVLVGPADDPAKVRGIRDAVEGLRRIAASRAVFASRGDDSGTHRMELRLWQATGAIPDRTSASQWYRELGAGMGQTLNTAAGLSAYTLADRATWASFRNRQDLTIVIEGDQRLHNPYGSILVNPAKGTHIRHAEARAWHEWLTTKAGQAAIESFRINGEQLFFVAATPPS